MRIITKCYTRAAATSSIASSEERATCSMSIVSSFANTSKIRPFHRNKLNVDQRQTQNAKSRFAKMLSRSIKAGLFENTESNMERATAVKKLGNLLGKKFGYRVDPRAPGREEREAAKAELGAACEVRNKLKDERDARFAAVLAADPEYQRLKAEHAEAAKAVERLGAITRHYKITVGVSRSIFFEVKAEGDSWEEIFDKLKTRQAT